MSSTSTRGICARVIHINARNAATIAHNLRQQTGTAASAPTIGTENRSGFVFVTLQTNIQRALRSRSVVRVGQVAKTSFRAGLSVVNAVVIPNAGTFFREAQVHVAGQPSGFVKKANCRAFLTRVCEILG